MTRSAPARIRSAARAAGLFAAVVIMVTGCQGIPSSGPVEEGLTGLSQVEERVLFAPPKPFPGASQEDIVQGFVNAASSPLDDYAVARQFLSEKYAAQWDPRAEVLVDDGQREFRAGSEAASTLSLVATAHVDRHGVLVPLAPGPRTEVRFELVRENGQWRISSAPNGVILDLTTFTDVWSSHTLHFGVAGGGLVSDTRWFSGRTTLSTQIVSALLAGPAETLQGVAVTGFPVGTELAAGGVPVESGTAMIDLSREFETATKAQVDLAVQQLAASLFSVPGVTGFTVTVDQVEVVPRTTTTPQTLVNAEEGERALPPGVIMDGNFGFITPRGFAEDGVLSRQFAEVVPRAISMSADQRSAAVLTADGVYWIGPQDIVRIDARPDLRAPAVDRHGYVWSYPPTGGVVLTKPGESVAELTLPWVGLGAIESLRVSPDGNRVAAMISGGSGTRVVSAGIVRDQDAKPLSIVESSRSDVLWVSGGPVDVDWIDNQQLVVLSRSASGVRVSYGGPGMLTQDTGSVPDAITVRGGGSLRTTLRVLNSEGVLFSRSGVGWQRQSTGYSLLSKRG